MASILHISCSAQTESSSKEIVVKDSAVVGDDGGQVKIEGSSIDIQPGTLVTGSVVSVANIDIPDEFNTTESVAASNAVSISAKDAAGGDIETVTVPMTIALDFGTGSNLLLAGNEAELCVLLKAKAGLYVWRYENLLVSNAKVEFKTLNFGVFQVVYCGKKKLSGFTETTKAITGEVGNKISMSISAASPTFGHTKYCMAAVRMDSDDNDDSADSGDSDGDFNAPVLATSESIATPTAKQTFSIEVAPGDIHDNKENYIIVMMQAQDIKCPLITGQSLTDDVKLTNNAFFAFNVNHADMRSGFEGTLHAVGPFATQKRELKIGRPSNAPGTGSEGIFAVSDICAQLDSNKGGHTTFSSSIGTSGFANANSFSIYEAIGESEVSELELRVKVGGKCSDISDTVVTDPSKGLPYIATFHENNMKANTPNYLTPVNLHVSLPAGVGCIRIYESGAIDAKNYDKVLGETLIKLGGITNQINYQIYLPLIDPAVYDMQITIMKEGKTCNDTASSTLPPQNLKNKTLSLDINIPE